MKAHKITKLKIRKVDAVDRGAAVGARVVLLKRHSEADHIATEADRWRSNMDAAWASLERLEKRAREDELEARIGEVMIAKGLTRAQAFETVVTENPRLYPRNHRPVSKREEAHEEIVRLARKQFGDLPEAEAYVRICAERPDLYSKVREAADLCRADMRR